MTENGIRGGQGRDPDEIAREAWSFGFLALIAIGLLLAVALKGCGA